MDRGLVISAIGHLGLLVIGLLYLGASAHEGPPPEATLVELVRPQDIPHFSGAPTDLRTSGLEHAFAEIAAGLAPAAGEAAA